jgi:hypothetical protein
LIEDDFIPVLVRTHGAKTRGMATDLLPFAKRLRKTAKSLKAMGIVEGKCKGKKKGAKGK